ncbi:TolC family protein [Spirosoma sp. SC4-14]|uniref:TolC family protein n=1 Tax=Spirosoma sp. SC4-14 TaxID=3128900 RepID=UPI0030CEC088
MKTYLLGWAWVLGIPALAQSSVTLEECYAAARAHYPQLRQEAILQQTNELAIANLNASRRLPQLTVNGQATWQSEVTKLPIELPNLSVPVLNKDQYKLTLDASYTLYDGQLTQLQTAAQQAGTATAIRQVEVELNRLKDQVNSLFLNALLTDENIRLTRILLDDLRNRAEKTRASVRFGTSAQINLDGLLAEALRTEQRLADLNASRQGLRASLQLLTGLPVIDSTRLVVVEPTRLTGLSLNRPELALYQAQRSQYDAQAGLINNRTKPRISLFAQPGVGRPGLNLLSNDFKPFFIGGLRLNWNLSAAYNLERDRQLVALNRQQVDVQQATFEQNIALQLRQQQTEIDRLEAQLSRDAEIVALRTKVRQAAAVQLDNGVLAARDYTIELNNENQALLNQKLHQLQRLLAIIQYRTISGN